jgi:peptidyl-prolyl cis-trans isomerase D
MLQRIHDSLSLGRWVVVIILGLIAFSFIFWGIDFGLMGMSNFAAKVNGEDVPLLDFDRELQERQNQYQQVYRTEITEDLRRELRRAVIDDLVSQTALRQRVEEQGYRASDTRVAGSIREMPAFQLDGQFDQTQYQGRLANAGMTPTQFEELQRQSLEVGDLQSGILDSTFLTPAEFRRYIELFNERREIAYALFETAAYSDDITIDEVAITTRYENNQASYQTAETVDLEYVELALADIAANVEISEEDLLAAYEEERERFETTEERRTRHILIAVEDGREDAAKAAADAVVTRLRSGEEFAAVAAEVSADAGSKGQGGDLGWVGRGMFPASFEDALFALEAGAISDPVRTDQGFHVIRVDEVRAGELQPFEAVREELAAELRTRRAEDEFYERANELGEKAFDAYDELASVAEETQLQLKTLMGFPRSGDPNAFENSAAVVQAAFAEEIVDSGRNSELVELADDHVLVLRVAMRHLPVTRPLDEVHEQIREELTRERAVELAEQAAQAFIAELESGAGDAAALATARGGMWNPPAWVTRTDGNVPTEVLSAAFSLPKQAVSAAQREIIALANGGQAVIQVTAIERGEPGTMAQQERDQRQRQLADQAARAEFTAYAATVRDKATVRVPPEVLEPPLF